MENLVLGSVSLSILISVVLQLIFNITNFSNKIKPFISVFIGILFGVLCFYYYEGEGFKMLIDYVVNGFMTGATAVGIYEMVKK